MARYIGPKGKLSRREGIDLYLKSSRRLLHTKCKLDSIPGSNNRYYKKRISDYGNQLRAKQKIKRIYGILERQFRKYFFEANRKKGNTGKILLNLLESRLDNIVYRIGFGSTRSEARQLLSHKALLVNGKTVNIASYQVNIGDIISIKNKCRKQLRIIESLNLSKKIGFPSWLSVNIEKFEAIYKKFPERENIYDDINESLVVELYSR